MKYHFCNDLIYLIYQNIKFSKWRFGKALFGSIYYGINLENSFPFAVKILKNKNEKYYSFQKELNMIREFKA